MYTGNLPYTKSIGRDQSFARAVNNELVINILREKECSATDLAKNLNLSNAAMSSILRNLCDDGIIKISGFISKCNKGRKQVIYSLNDEYGIIAVISLSNNRYTIIFSNIKEDILYEYEQEIDQYDVEIVHKIIDKIKSLLEEKYYGIPLRHIIISVPGRVNALTGELQIAKHFDPNICSGPSSIVKTIGESFNVPITLCNDINLAIIGETRNGSLKNINNAMLVYIDNGIGGALIFNGEFYAGDSGYAGEFGLTTITFNGQTNYLDEFASLRSIKEYVQSQNNFNAKCHVKDLLELYQKNKNIHNYINSTASLIGKKLHDFIEVLNLSHIVIAGRVKGFGEEYLEAIKLETDKAQNPCAINFSKSQFHNAILTGAISVAVEKSMPHVDNKYVAI